MELGVIFGGYRFDRSTGRLWSGKREVRLTPKAAAVLGALVTRAGDLVTKEELLASVWSDTAVSDDALTSCVQELRKALADNPKQPRFIETRHRRGYRFIPRVSDARAAPGRMSRRAIPTELMTAMARHTVRYVRRTASASRGRSPEAEFRSSKPRPGSRISTYDLDSPVWRHWTDFLSSRFRYCATTSAAAG